MAYHRGYIFNHAYDKCNKISKKKTTSNEEIHITTNRRNRLYGLLRTIYVRYEWKWLLIMILHF